MALKCKEFGSGFFKGIDEQITLFLKKKKITKNKLVSVQYATNAVGTYALVIYEE